MMLIRKGPAALAGLMTLAVVSSAWGQGQPLGPDPALEFEGRLGYAATADTLIACGAPACGGIGGANCMGLDGSTVTLDTFPDSLDLRVVHARLNWAASTAEDDFPDVQVTLTAPAGEPIEVLADPMRSERFIDGLAAGECGFLGAICPVQPACNLGFYSNHADITAQVEAHRQAGMPLNGEWTISDVQIPGSDENDPGTAVAAVGSLTIGAWSLLVVYEEPGEPVRRIYYYQGFELNSGINRSLFPRGFEAPPPDPALDMTIMVLEGDQPTVGDQLQVNGRQISDGCNPVNNVFNSTVNTGTADGQCRQGVQSTDLDRFTVVGAVEAGDDEARIDLIIPRGDGLITPGEQLFTNWMVLAFDHRLPDFEGLKPEKESVPPTGSSISPGGAISYRIQVENDGDGPAVGVVVRDPLSPLVQYVPGSTLLDGRPVPDGPGGAFPLQDGLELTGLPQVGDTIEIDEIHRLAFTVQVRRDAPNGATIENTATIAADLIDPLETETVVHTVVVSDGGLPPLPADAGVDGAVEPPADAGRDMSVGPARDAAPMSMDRGADGGPLLADADTSNPCGPGTRLNDEGFCVSVCGPGLRWDPTCDPGRCVHEDEPDCDDDGGGGSPGGGCACDAGSGGPAGTLLAVLLALGWRRRR